MKLGVASLLLAGLLAGCGSHPTSAPVARSAQTLGALGNGLPVVDGPVVSSKVLAYANTVARTLDARAAFLNMTGTKIDETGAPTGDGTWELSYLGGNVPAPAGKPVNAYMPYTRRIAISVTADGHAHFRQTVQGGIPLGVSFVTAPAPTVDSAEVYKLYFAQHPEATSKAPIAQMTLAGMVSAHHFDRLVWRVLAADQGDELPLLIDANSGALIDLVAKPNG